MPENLRQDSAAQKTADNGGEQQQNSLYYIEEKLSRLKTALRKLGSVAVAFSGGVDSAFLLKVAHDTLGDNAVAVTAKSCIFPDREFKEAEAFCRQENITQYICETERMQTLH